MPDDPRAAGRADDPGTTTDGRNTDISSPNAGPQAGDEPHRAFGSTTPGSGAPHQEGDPQASAGPTEGTPEDLKPGGRKPGIDPDDGADAGDHGRETAP
jgi:hypothetical protein